MGQPATLECCDRPGAQFAMPPDAALRCLWIKLGDRLTVAGFTSTRTSPHDHDVELGDRLAPVDVWVRGDDQVWLWGTGLIELTVAGNHCQLAYAHDGRSSGGFAEPSRIIADTALAFVRLSRPGV